MPLEKFSANVLREHHTKILAVKIKNKRSVIILREIVSVPVALVIYVISVALILAFCNWFFDKPSDYPYLIPIITSSFSMALACMIAEEKLNSKAGAKIAAVLIAAFWIIFVIVDLSGSVKDIIDVLTGKELQPDALDIIMMYVDILLNSKIFAVVSCLVAAGQIND